MTHPQAREEWVIEVCPECLCMVVGITVSHLGDCSKRFETWVPRAIEVVPKYENGERP